MPSILQRMRPLSIVLVTSTAMALSACGGDDNGSGTGTSGSGGDDREAVTAVVTGYTDAFADGDFDKACDYLTDDARQQIEKAGEAIDADGCSDALDKVTESLDDKTRDALRKLEVTGVQIDGDRATVQSRIPGSGEQTDPATLVREDGEWHIAPTATGSGGATATVGTVTAPESP